MSEGETAATGLFSPRLSGAEELGIYPVTGEKERETLWAFVLKSSICEITR